MTNIDFLNRLEAEGILKQLICRGLLPLKVSLHREIYLQVQAEMNINGGKKRKAVLSVCEKLDVDMSTVWKACYHMKKSANIASSKVV